MPGRGHIRQSWRGRRTVLDLPGGTPLGSRAGRRSTTRHSPVRS